MKLISLKLTNFGQISSCLLNFRNGINIISGRNGQGKSTVLKAITLHLFDSVKGNLEDYIQWGKDYFETELIWEHQGKKFTQTIYYSKKVSKRDLYIDDEYYKNSDASKQLALFFEPKLSLASVISAEQEVDLVNVKPAERREYLKSIYNLNFTRGVKEIDEEIKQLQETDIDNIEKKIYFLENKIYPVQVLLIHDISIAEYDSNIVELENNVLIKNNFELKNKTYENYINTIEEIDIKISKLKNDNYNIKNDCENINLLLNKLEIDKLEIENNYNLDILKLSSMKEQDLEVKVREFQKERYLIEFERLEEFDEQSIKDCMIKMSKLNLDYSRIKDKIKLCESGKCPTCGKDFDSSELSLYLTERDNIERAIAESEIEQNELLSRQADIAQQREAENKKQSRYDLLE